MSYIFIFVQLSLYIIYEHLDFANKPSSFLKYLFIFFCFVYCLYKYLKYKERNNLFLLFALTLTLVADYFLLLTNSHYEIGVGLFCLVQTIYYLRIGNYKSIFSRLLLVIIGFVVLYNLKMISLVNCLSIYSIVYLLENVIDSIIKKENIFFICGLILFTLCDISVGLYNLDILVNITSYSMWINYGLSQILICLKGGTNEKK